ncbi:hypothetical protein [Cellvibrio sp. ARAG 10.3]|uniref:hypothetical protein n=1 Tax=Cellvibrio sp. ARAG 10.3 TaxID=3451358 RepID=UPI003F6DFA4C
MEFTTDLEEMLDEIGPEVGDLEFMQFSRHNLRLADHWKNFFGTFKKIQSEATAIHDITCWRGATLVLSESASNSLKHILQPNGELLPITCNGENYYIFNCLSRAEIDKSKSKQLNLKEGLIEFENIKFEESSIQGKALFKSKDEGCTATFCTNEFVDLVMNLGMKGVRFSENLTEIFRMSPYRLINDIFTYHEAFVDFKALRRQFNDVKVWLPQENASLLDELKAEWIPVNVKFESDSKKNIFPDLSV